ncbi:MAG: hypothetical protein JWR37_2799 [Mycobacterium sp.]|nr:hypothetical protein [Mycobacterium sp.]
MGHIEATKHPAAAPEALWSTVADLANWDKWFTIHEKWLEDPPAALTPGTRLVAKIVMLGMANRIEVRRRDGGSVPAGDVRHQYGGRQVLIRVHRHADP